MGESSGPTVNVTTLERLKKVVAELELHDIRFMERGITYELKIAPSVFVEYALQQTAFKNLISKRPKTVPRLERVLTRLQSREKDDEYKKLSKMLQD